MDRQPIGAHLFDLVGQHPDEVGVLAGLIFNFTLSRTLVFRKMS